MGVNNSKSRKNERRQVAVTSLEQSISSYEQWLKRQEHKVKQIKNQAGEDKEIYRLEFIKKKLLTSRRDLAATKQKLT